MIRRACSSLFKDPAPLVKRRISSVNRKEIAKFNDLTDWWDDKDGSMALLHRMNRVRVSYIQQWITKDRVKYLDMGCGAGLLTESLARLGNAELVVGADMAVNNIHSATAHARKDPALNLKLQSGQLRYVNQSAENLVLDHGPMYDCVCSLEVIEHVSNPAGFMASLIQLAQPSGLIFLSTINRTWVSKLLAVTVAENVLGLVPRNTHDPDMFVTPAEIRQFALQSGAQVLDVQGLWYNPVTPQWSLGCVPNEEMYINYITCLRKV